MFVGISWTTMRKGIIAGIVTFEPELERLEENIRALHSQVDQVIVFDNGSSNAAATAGIVSRFSSARMLTSPANRGIAYALNRLAEAALHLGAKSLLTMDQDSVAPSGMVSVLSAALVGDIGIVTPFIVDRNKPEDFERVGELTHDVEFYLQPARRGAITSGSLVLLDAWSAAGGYDEEFFIDYVDYDFNQRVFEAGFRIARANRVQLLHEVGRASATWLRVPRKDISGRWRWERFYSFGHSPVRCYYKARNRVLFTRKHGRRLGLTHEGVWQLPQQIILTLVFEQQRREKLDAFIRGILDGIRWASSDETPHGK